MNIKDGFNFREDLKKRLYEREHPIKPKKKTAKKKTAKKKTAKKKTAKKKG